MSIDKFVHHLWRGEFANQVHNHSLFGRLFDCYWNQAGAPITEWGEHISLVRDDDKDSQIVPIDYGAYFNFFVNDIEVAQNDLALMHSAMQNASHKTAQGVDDYLVSTIRKSVAPCSFGDSGTELYNVLQMAHIEIEEWFNEPIHHVKPCVVLPLSTITEIRCDNRFFVPSNTNEPYQPESATNAFNIYFDHDGALDPGEALAFSPYALAWTGQVVRMEPYKTPMGFGHGVKGLYLCGAEVVHPSWMCRFYLK